MVSQIPNTYVTTFASNMRMALSQQDAILAPLAMEEDGKGELYQLQNIIGNGKNKKRNQRNMDVVYDENTHDRVWVAAPGQDYDADLVDTLDKVKSGIDLQGGYVMKQAGVMRRAKDAAFLFGFDGTGGFFGNMLMGKTGSTVVPFANANIIPVNTGASSPTGLNLAKIIDARTCLIANHVNPNQPFYLAVTADEVKDLYTEAKATSQDYQAAFAIKFSADGKSLTSVAGFEFVQIELNNPDLPFYDLAKDSNGYQRNPFWSKDGMTMVWWQRLTNSIDRLPQKFNAIQLLSTMMVTATRTDNARCGYILNN